jgi:hypothetical protein
MFKNGAGEAATSEEAKAYFLPYVEPLREARTKLAAFFNILLRAMRVTPHTPS